MKRILALTITAMLLLSACSAAAPAKAPETQAQTQAQTEAQTQAQTEAAPAGSEAAAFVFKHGFDMDYPPYSYIASDGQTGGFDVELCQAVCDYLGWGYEAVPFNWDAKDAELNAGSCDCIWSGFTINGREDDYLWTFPYSDNTQMIMVPDDSEIKTLEDLKGKTVGVQIATSAMDLLSDEEGQKELADTFGALNTYETYTIAFNDLKAGAIDAIAIDVTSGNYLMNKNSGYHFLDEVLGSEQYAIGFRKGDEELKTKVEEALNALVENGTYDAIGQKYPDIYDFLCLGK